MSADLPVWQAWADAVQVSALEAGNRLDELKATPGGADLRDVLRVLITSLNEKDAALSIAVGRLEDRIAALEAAPG